MDLRQGGEPGEQELALAAAGGARDERMRSVADEVDLERRTRDQADDCGERGARSRRDLRLRQVAEGHANGKCLDSAEARTNCSPGRLLGPFECLRRAQQVGDEPTIERTSGTMDGR